MKMMNALFVSVFAVFMALVATPALAVDVTQSTPGISGYNPVTYFTEGKPMRGSGYYVAGYQGVTYAFSSKETRKCLRRPQKSSFLPMAGTVPMGLRLARNLSLTLKCGKSWTGHSI